MPRKRKANKAFKNAQQQSNQGNRGNSNPGTSSGGTSTPGGKQKDCLTSLIEIGVGALTMITVAGATGAGAIWLLRRNGRVTK